MLIILIVITILIAAGVIVNLRSKKNKSTLAEGEILIADETPIVEPVQEVAKVPTTKAVKKTTTSKKPKTQVTKKQK